MFPETLGTFWWNPVSFYLNCSKDLICWKMYNFLGHPVSSWLKLMKCTGHRDNTRWLCDVLSYYWTLSVLSHTIANDRQWILGQFTIIWSYITSLYGSWDKPTISSPGLTPRIPRTVYRILLSISVFSLYSSCSPLLVFLAVD